MTETGTFRVKGTNRTFTINYSEGLLITPTKTLEFIVTITGGSSRFMEDGEFRITGNNWFIFWVIDEGRYRHLTFVENNKLMELELISGGWPEDYI